MVDARKADKHRPHGQGGMPGRPLILTLRLDPKTHATLTSLRAKYFPKSRNHLEAHITLFHAIPPHRRQELHQHLNEICAKRTGWDVFVGEPSKMGKRGVMLRVRQRPGGTVESIHQHLQHRLMDRSLWTRGEEDALTEQDQRSMGRPHITVLNKAQDEEEVDKCLAEVKQTFDGMKDAGEKVGQIHGRAVGFQLVERLIGRWEYLGGPWGHLQDYWLQGEEPRGSKSPTHVSGQQNT